MLSFVGGARSPLRCHLLAARGGRRTFFPGQGQTAALLVVAQSQLPPCFLPLLHHANNSSRGRLHVPPPPATFSPPFTPTTTCTRGFATSRKIEKAGVSKSDSDKNDASDEYADCTRSAEEESATAAAAHTRLVFRRLYRILFRRINQLEHALLLQHRHAAVDDFSSVGNNNRDNNSNTNENGDPLLLLLQPPLNPHCVGSSRIIDNISDASAQQVLTLFYHWSLYAVGGMGSNTNDDDNENENKKDDLEDKFTDWLDAVCPDHREHENGNNVQRRRHQYPWQENRSLDTLWIRIPVLRQAIRQAFSAAVFSRPREDNGNDDDGYDIHDIDTSRQFYIQASIQAYKFMSQQLAMIPLTSTSTTSSFTKTTMDDDGGTITTYSSDDGTFVTTTTTTSALTSDDSNEEEEPVIDANNTLVRVTAVSRWIGRSLNPSHRHATTTAAEIASSHDHHFVYRIRIENLVKSSDAENTAAVSGGGGGGGTIVQLNGRSWEIESLPLNDTDKDNLSPKSENQEAAARDILKVHAPREGAVGQHPSLGPEQAFEYYSRCDLSTPIGTMQGRFYFTIVSSPHDDNGDNKKNGKKKIKEEAAKNRHFQVEVHPFSLRAERF